MAEPKSPVKIDLTPDPKRKYCAIDREWREEFIYFLMVDRFHDDTDRKPATGPGRSRGVRVPEGCCGGKIRGITRNLDYIAGLGCTAIWLSPVFGNSNRAGHGCDVGSRPDVDPRFGTKPDLVELVRAAHACRRGGRAWPIRVILDVLLSHPGDNWSDPGSDPGSDPIDALIKAHAYWIREADVDGFRVAASRQLSAPACARFCSGIREYAYSLGKRGFFLFGEPALPDDEIVERYSGPSTARRDDRTACFGLDAVLDFPLAAGRRDDPGRRPLRDVLQGRAGPETLFNRLEAQRRRALNRDEIGRHLVTFVDNHESFWQPGRIGAGPAPEGQVIGAIGFLLCALGTPCIYYGTEQGFEGQGGDGELREAMFDPARPGRNLLNTGCRIYRAIARIAGVVRASAPLRFGRMYYREISGDGERFGFPCGTSYTLAFSRLLYGSEVLVAYNVAAQRRRDCVIVEASHHAPGEMLTFLYGAPGAVPVRETPDGARYVQLDLAPRQFVILG